MGVAPAGVVKPLTGHHHLLVDTDMVDLNQPIPSDYNHIHLGNGQTEVVMTLPPGTIRCNCSWAIMRTFRMCRLSCRKKITIYVRYSPTLTKLLCVLASLALIGLSAARAEETAAEGEGSRVALVIGNGAYPTSPIPDAVSGAKSVVDVLRQGGFRVLYRECHQGRMQRGLATFARELESGGDTGSSTILGETVQYQGRNYLVALDTKIAGSEDSGAKPSTSTCFSIR